ncbi:hypothetical protein HPB47_002989 [Ixodes persulcatus]|uniref:Uncharacterized protein n=1 Tax=Ixodes persulcatus TaxID=34615 RepID=A0AC60PLB8_IXOPE|nr:hypothetical protein HPB47_002989 [Ixodes persulcatus]
MRHEAYSSLTGLELKRLDVAAVQGLKQVPEMGLDTEQEMASWGPQEKKAFRVGVQAFYISTARHLLKQLPLDNKLLFHLRFMNPCTSLTVEEKVQSLKYVAGNVPHMIKGEQVAALVDECHPLHCQPTPASGWSQDSTSDSYWATALASGTSNGVTQKYPLLSVFLRALLSLPHGNADCERGFSENKHIMDSRANLGIAAVNGIRQVKSFVKRFDSDPSRVPLTRELLKAVQRSHKTYSERLQGEAEDRERRKRKASTVCEPVTDKKIKLGEEKLCVERCLESSKAMMEHAQGLMKMGLRHKNMDEIESGQVLLAEANASLSANMAKLATVNEKLQRL